MKLRLLGGNVGTNERRALYSLRHVHESVVRG